MNLYAETSAVLRWLLGAPLGEDVRLHLGRAENVFASRLTLIEAHRTLVRATVLVASLEAARQSFWTPVWVTSELPHVLLALLVVATAYAFTQAPPSLREAPAHV